MAKGAHAEAIEKYQHFLSGIMFAIAAAAIQTAKPDRSHPYAAGLEVVSWCLIVLAACLGVFAARSYTLSARHIDQEEYLRLEFNGTRSEDISFVILEVANPDGTKSQKNVNKQDYLQDLHSRQLEANRELIRESDRQEVLSRYQLIIFIGGLALLMASRSVEAIRIFRQS